MSMLHPKSFQRKDAYNRLPIEGLTGYERSKFSRRVRSKQILAAALLLFGLCATIYLTIGTQTDKSSEVQLSMLLSAFNKSVNMTDDRLILGNNFDRISLPDSALLLPADGQKMKGKAFNLAFMRLPPGARWEYIAVARGPQKEHSHELVMGTNESAVKASVIGFGMNMTAEGRLRPVSKATFLYIRTGVSLACEHKDWNQWSGPEDARIYWSDSGTPMISVGIPSTVGLCRGIALIQDLRSVWPELTSVLAFSNVHSYIAGVPEYEMLEVLKENQDNVEKNWAPFYPGASPDPTLRLPSFIYSSSPEVKLMPPVMSTSRLSFTKSLPSITYTPLVAHSNSYSCVKRAFPHVQEVDHHGATPLYRLTMCNRGDCEPNEQNTYFLSLIHILLPDNAKKHHTYGRYFALHNVISPYEIEAIGPSFHFSDTNDGDVVYGTCISFLPESIKKEKQTARFGPIHGFLDDAIMIGLGLGDEELATIRLSLKGEILSKMVSCHDSKVSKVTKVT